MATSDDLNITSANSEIILTVENLYPSGIKLEGYSTDTAWASEDVTLAEGRMGVDGKLAIGMTPSPKTITLTFEANSPSLKQLENIAACMDLNMTIYATDMQVTIPSRKKEYHLTKGSMMRGRLLPDGKKVLDPQAFTFMFEKIKPSSI